MNDLLASAMLFKHCHRPTLTCCDESPNISIGRCHSCLTLFTVLRLCRVTDFEEHNHMTAEALAIVFSPNLLRAPQNDFVMILNNMGHSHKLVKALITHVCLFTLF